jgi:hypothetical protein
LKATGQDTRIHFDGHKYIVDFPQNLVHFANFAFVLEVDTGVEVGYFVGQLPLAQQFAFDVVRYTAGFDNFRWRTFVAGTKASAAAATSW